MIPCRPFVLTKTLKCTNIEKERNLKNGLDKGDFVIPRYLSRQIEQLPRLYVGEESPDTYSSQDGKRSG